MQNTLNLGTVFSIPLKAGLTCSGVVSAISRHRKIKILQVYILNCDAGKLLDGSYSASVARYESILIAETNSMRFIDQTWVILGTIPNWKQEDWFISEFCHQTLDGRWHKVIYDTNLKKSPGGNISKQEADAMPEDRILPSIALEETLKLIFKGSKSRIK